MSQEKIDMPQYIYVALRHFLAWMSRSYVLERAGHKVTGTVFDGGRILHRSAWHVSLEEKEMNAQAEVYIGRRRRDFSRSRDLLLR